MAERDSEASEGGVAGGDGGDGQGGGGARVSIGEDEALSEATRAVVRWNRAVAVGDEVDYYPTTTSPTAKRARTRSSAVVLGGHTAVVWLEGVAGCVGLAWCTPVTRVTA